MNNVDLDLPRGDTGRWNLSFSVNLTDAKIWFTAKRKFTDSDSAALIALSTGSGITITDALNGEASLIIPPSATATLDTPSPPAPLTLFYDIQVKEADGSITTVQQGRLYVRGDITRSTV